MPQILEIYSLIYTDKLLIRHIKKHLSLITSGLLRFADAEVMGLDVLNNPRRARWFWPELELNKPFNYGSLVPICQQGNVERDCHRNTRWRAWKLLIFEEPHPACACCFCCCCCHSCWSSCQCAVYKIMYENVNVIRKTDTSFQFFAYISRQEYQDILFCEQCLDSMILWSR